MAAVIGDYMTDQLRFHNSIANSALQHEHHPSESRRSQSHSRPRALPSQRSHSPDSLPRYRSATTGSKSSDRHKEPSPSETEHPRASAHGGASRIPTPPDSSSPDPSARAKAHDAKSPSTGSMSTQTQTAASAVSVSTSTADTPIVQQQQQQPSPGVEPVDSAQQAESQHGATPAQTRTVVVRDLAHIQSLAEADAMNGGNGPGILNEQPLQAVKYEISGMPIGDVIEMVAALLSKITSTNDLQHDALHRNAAHQQTAASHNNDGSSMTGLSSSVLAFHGKNVPAITILSYLSRIHKYCPTTYEVFLSLLVYFDRMTERVNSMVVQAEESRRQTKTPTNDSTSSAARIVRPKGGEQDVDETNSDLADDDDEETEKEAAAAAVTSATYFVVDSFNIHRLIIAGVTCASKFFSDVFYTNSRYAKVGGLPLPELNHLELQFLQLNDFRLAVPVEDLEAYGTMLVEFYAREVCAQRSRSAGTE